MASYISAKRCRKSASVIVRRYFLPDHLALAALAAIWERLRGPSLAALAAPPFSPPSRPRATAAGFFGFSTGVYLGACPVDSSMIWYARWFGSRGRGSRFFERSGMAKPV